MLAKPTHHIVQIVFELKLQFLFSFLGDHIPLRRPPSAQAQTTRGTNVPQD